MLPQDTAQETPLSPQQTLEETPQEQSIEELLKTVNGVSTVTRQIRKKETGEEEIFWQAVGSWGRGGEVADGVTITEAVENLVRKPYHLDPSLGRRESIPDTPSDEDLLARAIVNGKSEAELLQEANITHVKYNWEVSQTLPRDESWSVSGGNGKVMKSYHANTLYDALAKAYVFGTLGLKILREDSENFYLDKYIPGLGLPHEVSNQSGLETRVRKQDIHALLEDGKTGMFQ